MALNRREIGNRIALLRKSRHLTQEQLAELLEVTPKHVSSVERGLSTYSLEKMDQLCDILDTDINYLIYGKIQPGADLYRIPNSILKLLESGSSSDIELLEEYMLMFTKLRKH